MSRIPDMPAGSIIEQREESGGMTLRWMPPKMGIGRWFVGGFLSFWLCGWAVGWCFAFWALFLSADTPWPARLFLAVWLGAWTCGGLAAMWALGNLVRPPRPEAVTLGYDSLTYDPGSMWWIGQRHPHPHVAAVAPTLAVRKPVTVARADLTGFRLEHVGTRQRLSFDRGADRIEIGACLREPEREWLHAVLEQWHRD